MHNPVITKMRIFVWSQTCNIYPKTQVQESQFKLHISYFLQKCKKGKPHEMDLPNWKNDITTIFYKYDACV